MLVETAEEVTMVEIAILISCKLTMLAANSAVFGNGLWL
jgi:hypothetical protein